MDLETLLTKKIKEAEPSLDISGADRKLLQLAYQDLTNYLNFNHYNTNHKTLITSYIPPNELTKQKNLEEIESFLTVWSQIWLNKWKQRVNLSIGKKSQNQLKKPLPNANAETLLKLECKEEMTQIVVNALIRKAEICGTKIIAEYLLAMEISKIQATDINSRQQVFTILNNTLRRVREIAQIKGPLISIQIDKSYYYQLTNHTPMQLNRD